MNNFRDLMDGLGLTPQTWSPGPGRVSEYVAGSPIAQQVARKRALAQLAAQIQVPQYGAGVSGGNNPLAEFNGVGSSYNAPNPDDGFQFSDIGGALKDGFMKAIEVIDTPRAYVSSALKEGMDAFWATDVGRWTNDLGEDTDLTDAEWKAKLDAMGATGGWENADFTQQASEHKGFGDWIEMYDTEKDTPMWLKRTVGFFGDVGSDPTLRVAATGKTVARGAGLVDDVIRQAVNEGGRNQIGKALLSKAAQEGVELESAALIKSAMQRGRGALTPKALARAGVDDALAAKLGLPSMSREFLGVSVKGSATAAHVVEGAKGAVKEALGSTAAARYLRALRVSSRDGERALINAIRDKGTSAEKVLAATHMLSESGLAKSATDKWSSVKFLSLKQRLAPLRELDEAGRVNLTHAVEDMAHGEFNGLAGELDAAFGSVADDMIGFGVEFEKRQGYMPHLLTLEARKSNDPLVKAWLSKADSEKFFQKARTLTAGKTFLGETLQHGTIKEINDISARKLGFKVLEDDSATLLGVYLGQAHDAVQMAHLRVGLKARGVATDAIVMRELSEDQAKVLAETQAKAVAEWGAQTVALRDGTHVRFDQARQIGRELKVRRRKVLGELDALRANVNKVARDRSAWEARIGVLRADLPSLERALEQARSVAKKARGTAQAGARKRVAVLERALEVRTTELAALEARIAKLPKGGIVAKVAKAEYADVSKNIDQLTQDLAGFADDQARLHQAVTPLGQAGIAGEEAFRNMEAHVADVTDQINKDAANVLDADMTTLALEGKIQVLDTLMGKLDEGIAKAKKKGFVRGGADHEAVRTHVNQVRAALGRVSAPTDPMVKAMLDLESRAAIFDIKAALHGKKAATFEDMIKTMESPEFGEVIRHQAAYGHKLWGADIQVPEWVDEIYTVQHKLDDPTFFSEAGRFYRNVQNVWKAWATGRPGFLVRNAYSSMFNVYLEAGAGATKSVNTFSKFYRIVEKNPDNYMEEALKVFKDEGIVQKLDQALGAMYGTGGGRTVNEVVDNVFQKGTYNPASAQFKPLRAVRTANGHLEAVIRGGHAFDVIQRGGSADLATDIVRKWHFDYSNATEFDQKMKMAVPFWGFMSNNIALQSHVWTHDLGRLNRSYMNVIRQMEVGQPDEVNAPDWLEQSTPIPVEVNPDGNSTYLVPGLPTFDFLRDVSNIGDPAKLASNLSPPIGLALEGIAGRNLFTDRPLTGMRDAGMWGMIPGLGEPTGSGGTTITPYQYDLLNGLLPGGSNVNRLTGGTNTPISQALAGWLGASYTQVTPNQRKGVEYGRRQDAKAAAAKRKMLAEL